MGNGNNLINEYFEGKKKSVTDRPVMYHVIIPQIFLNLLLRKCNCVCIIEVLSLAAE